VQGGAILHGRLCKATLGSAAGGFIDAVSQDFGSWAVARLMSDAHRIMHWFYSTILGGASIGLQDFVMTPAIRTNIRDIVKDTLRRAEMVTNLKGEALAEDKKERAIVQILSSARQRVEGLVMTALDDTNDLRTAVYAGAKGSPSNVAQICASVLQQMYNGARLQPNFYYSGELGYGGAPHGAFRTLLTKAAGDMSPTARGFVAQSFLEGLSFSSEMLHLIATRYGIIDTAVKTAKVGYILRKLRSAMMSNAACHDGAVRSAEGLVIELAYGDDCMDGKNLCLIHLPAICMSDEDLARKVIGEDVGSEACLAAQAARRLLFLPRMLEADPEGGVSCAILAPFHIVRVVSAAKQSKFEGDEPATLQDLERAICGICQEIRECHAGL